MKSFVKVMKAAADPNRVRILKMLEQKEMCVCEIRAALGLAQPTVSTHLKILEEAGLVARRKEGLWVNYCRTKGDSPYAEALLHHLRDWLNEDPEIRKILRRLPYLDREEICRVERKPAGSRQEKVKGKTTASRR
jgi:ArsR family transcriptional regulator